MNVILNLNFTVYIDRSKIDLYWLKNKSCNSITIWIKQKNKSLSLSY